METQQQQKTYIMIFHIGPVQEFIAQARKTRDLWFGSYLLSELGKAAASCFQQNGGQLILPAAQQVEGNSDVSRLKVANVANKVIGSIILSETPREVALQVRQAVEKKWEEYAYQALQALNQKVNEAMWQRQIKDVLEFYAVWAVYDESKPYSDVLASTEQLMAGRKSLRDFRVHEFGERFGETKSSLDAGRESVLWKDQYAVYSKFGIKRGETLDAISLVKRMSRYSPGLSEREFKSVCDVAFQPFQCWLKKDGNDQALHQASAYYDNLPEPLQLKGTTVDHFDSRLFYDNRVDEYVAEQVNRPFPLSEEQQLAITQRICAQLEQLYAQLSRRPSPYYAFLVCDGDRVGQHLGKLRSIEEHQDFANRLSRYAIKAEQIVTKHGGQLVYCGGDDLMAYLPLHTCLDTVHELQQSFISIAGETSSTAQNGSTPTLSAGLAIVHMFEMLGDARRLAMQTEQLAKQKRNALAIHFQKRNGGDALKFSVSFGKNPIAGIKEIQSLYREGLISTRFALELRSLQLEYTMLQANRTVEEGRLALLMKQEVQRKVNKKVVKELRESVIRRLTPLLDDVQGNNSNALRQFGQFAEQCICAIMLAKEGDIHDSHYDSH